jgi:hypothetical protein
MVHRSGSDASDRAASIQEALDFAKKAVALDTTDGRSWCMQTCVIYLVYSAMT